MHTTSLEHMTRCIERFMSKDRDYVVVDFGSRQGQPHKPTHKTLFEGYRHRYVGVDIAAGDNVDVVMAKPYSIPLKSRSADIVITGQVFEHVPFIWASFLELVRILKPGGYIFMTVPSRGHRHAVPYDCWRYYPDAMRALAAFGQVELCVATTDFPPVAPGGKRSDYRRIPAREYWGDTVGVFRKTADHPRLRVALVREVVKWWANRTAELKPIPRGPRPVAPAAPGASKPADEPG
jgi:SAM-dependent methyltransferase